MANFVKCTNGHDFDLSVFQFCPFCGAPMLRQAYYQPAQNYQPMQPQQGYQPPQFAQNYQPPQPVQEASAPQHTASDTDDERNQNPTVGWLVCTKGASCGKTFPLREGRNFIGARSDMDIVLSKEDKVSDRKHAVITYVPKQNCYVAQQGSARELYYVNGEAVLQNVTLKEKDVIEIGQASFLFVPLCGNVFQWDKT